eukprot:scaffold1514_cov118-Cylindrotheca_fusiformis.AAC.12
MISRAPSQKKCVPLQAWSASLTQTPLHATALNVCFATWNNRGAASVENIYPGENEFECMFEM